VARALRSRGHAVAELDPKPGAWRLAPGTDVVFLALHGTYGEDGAVQSELDALGVPYTGCDEVASRVAFDKAATKRRCVAAGVTTPRFAVLNAATDAWPDGWQPPVVLKPVRQGSSVGLEFVNAVADLRPALARALAFDREVLMEDLITGAEATVGILDDEALPVVEVVPKTGSYDYANKYTAGRTNYFCPARFDAALTARMQALALGAFAAVGGRDYARVDVMVGADGSPVVLEVNTLPGMTELSLLPKAAAAAGLSFPDLCERMIALALRRRGSLANALPALTT
jgi:D-alanine-D-alanine ligase